VNYWLLLSDKELIMNFKLRPFLTILILAVLAVTIPASAKGPVTLITISGGGLEEQIKITDPEILDRFNPWAGQFIGTGGALKTPPSIGYKAPYEVHFYLQNAQDQSELRYMFYYYPNPVGGRGLIYFPGSGEPYYSINAGTIMRGGSDGYWHYSMPTWDETVSGLVQGAKPTLSNVLLEIPIGLLILTLVNLVILIMIARISKKRFPLRDTADMLS
jgi:hypothetical protein